MNLTISTKEFVNGIVVNLTSNSISKIEIKDLYNYLNKPNKYF
jgi:hypothetical protein